MMTTGINRRSIRFRTTAGAALALLGLMVLSGLIVTTLVAREVRQAADATLTERAGDRAILLESGVEPTSLVQVVGDEVVAAVFAVDGSILAQAGTTDATALAELADGVTDLVMTVDESGHDGPDSEGGDSKSGEGDIHLEELRAALATTSDGRRVAVAVEDEQTRGVIASVGIILIVASLATAATATALAWVITGRALAPVRRIRNDLDAVVEARGRSRVTEPDTGDEVASLATTLNGVLGQLEAQSTARRRFVADASHELKSPVANARALIETGQPSPELDRRVLSELDRLRSLVDDLLYLAHADEGAPGHQAVLVDLDDLVFDEAERVTASTEHRIDASKVQPASVLGDRASLARAVRNLVENAARYASSRVEVAIEHKGDRWLLSVSDDGPGIDEAERERIFERFTRLADDRARADGGTGLGLSIVATVAEEHGGSVAAVEPLPDADGQPGSGARFELTLPRADDAGDHDRRHGQDGQDSVSGGSHR